MARKKTERPKLTNYTIQLDPTVFNEAAQTMQAAAQLMAKGVAVDVNVQGNAQATLSRGTATIYSGSSYANAIADATAGY